MNYGFRPRPNYNNGQGFWGPFLLGGITGGLISPIFYNRPNYYYPYYGGFYYR